MPKQSSFVVLALSAAALVSGACGGGKSTPTSPSTPTPPPAAATRIIGVSGNLAFGDVVVGGGRELSFTISNTGNSTLTISGMTIGGGLASHTTASWTNGTIPAGGSQSVTVRFAPTAAGTFSGTLTVNGDQTSGGNTLSVSGTGVLPSTFSGSWSGRYVVERCDGTGSVQDLFCSANRGAYPVGSSLPISLVLTQSGSSVSGTVAFGSVTGVVTGVVSSSGVLTIQGTARSGELTLTITSWNSVVVGERNMSGSFGFNVGLSSLPGVAAVTNRLSGVAK